jgi:uncharacterized protein
MSCQFVWVNKNVAVQALIFGTDIPSLSQGVLHRACDLLDTCDVVVGPAVDGGYYLIGMKGPNEQMFKGIPWSTSEVYQATLTRACELDLKMASRNALPCLQDIDVIEV